MKKILLKTNFLMAMVFSCSMLISCEDELTLTPLSETDSTCTTCEGSKMPSAVSMSYFKSLISNYRNNHWQTINNHLNTRPNGDVDSRSVWFDINELKNFINTVENSVASKCNGNHCDKQLGIRIYFGEYDATNNPQYAGYHTLVMVPTIKNSNKDKWNTPEENVDFDYRYLNGCEPKCPDSTTVEIMALMPNIENTDMGAMNHGALIPPPDKVCTGARFMDLVDYLDHVKGFCSCK